MPPTSSQTSVSDGPSRQQHKQEDESPSHEFTETDITNIFNKVFGNDEYAKEKLLPNLHRYVAGEKVKEGIDLAVEFAFYDAFDGLPPFVVSVFEMKKDQLKDRFHDLLS